MALVKPSFIPISGEVVISKSPAMEHATEAEREAAIADLFSGLTDAITKHGCQVDLSDPVNIRVTKK
ncbi:MAG: hypothetical protein ACXV8O_01235 [Methylobacter sp.]